MIPLQSKAMKQYLQIRNNECSLGHINRFQRRVQQPIMTVPQWSRYGGRAHSSQSGSGSTSVDLKLQSKKYFTESIEPYMAANGSLHLILGPMMSGKSSLLVSACKQLQQMKLNVFAVKSSLDDRYSLGALMCHPGGNPETFPCECVSSLNEIFQSQQLFDSFKAAQVIAIDEAQFFDDLPIVLRKILDNYPDKIVIAAMLDGDYKREQFGQTMSAVPLANTITKLSARCTECSARAPYTARVSESSDQILVGGSDLYKPLCLKHYTLFMKGKQQQPVAKDSGLYVGVAPFSNGTESKFDNDPLRTVTK